MKVFTKQKQNKNNLGFTMLFASLVGALVVAVGIAILNITLKQITLASASRESQQAFFSADSGVECALFLDRGAGFSDCRLGFFATPSTTASAGFSVCGVEPSNVSHLSTPGDVQCFGRELNYQGYFNHTSLNAYTEQNSFILEDPTPFVNGSGNDNGNMCFTVFVTKKIDDPSTPEDDTKTIIESRGYNTCADTVNKFERAIRTETR